MKGTTVSEDVQELKFGEPAERTTGTVDVLAACATSSGAAASLARPSVVGCRDLTAPSCAALDEAGLNLDLRAFEDHRSSYVRPFLSWTTTRLVPVPNRKVGHREGSRKEVEASS